MERRNEQARAATVAIPDDLSEKQRTVVIETDQAARGKIKFVQQTAPGRYTLPGTAEEEMCSCGG